jgi:hypothetical protein
MKAKFFAMVVALSAVAMLTAATSNVFAGPTNKPKPPTECDPSCN